MSHASPDFAITESSVLVMDLPVLFDLESGASEVHDFGAGRVPEPA